MELGEGSGSLSGFLRLANGCLKLKPLLDELPMGCGREEALDWAARSLGETDISARRPACMLARGGESNAPVTFNVTQQIYYTRATLSVPPSPATQRSARPARSTPETLTSSYVKNDVAMLGATFTTETNQQPPQQSHHTLTQVGPQSAVQPSHPFRSHRAPQRIHRTTVLGSPLHPGYLHLPT